MKHIKNKEKAFIQLLVVILVQLLAVNVTRALRPPIPEYIPEIPEFTQLPPDDAFNYVSLEELEALFSDEAAESTWKNFRLFAFPEELSLLPNPPNAESIVRRPNVIPSVSQSADFYTSIIRTLDEGKSSLENYYVVKWENEVFPYSLKKTVQYSAELVHFSGKTLTAITEDAVNLVGGELYRTWNAAIPAFLAKLTEEQVTKIQLLDDVDLVVPDFLMEFHYDQVISDDGLYGLDRIDEVNTSDEDIYRYARNGSGVHVYVIDSGILASHDEFTSPNRIGSGMYIEGGSTTDTLGHGTHVAGIVGGETYGVAKGVTLHPVRVSQDGTFTASEAITAINWVIDEHGSSELAVANMSFGWHQDSFEDEDEQELFGEAIENLMDDGVVVVVSAGNDNDSVDEYFPAGFYQVITVAASTSDDSRYISSNYGILIDLFAPGAAVLSAGIEDNSDTIELSGTSMAAAHVAGIAARYLQVVPTASPTSVATFLANNAVTGKLSGSLGGSPNRLLFYNGWYYPYHTYDEWENSDTAISSNHWFYRSELGGWIWTNDTNYANGWIYRDADSTWLQLWNTTPFLTFYNQTTTNLEVYQE